MDNSGDPSADRPAQSGERDAGRQGPDRQATDTQGTDARGTDGQGTDAQGTDARGTHGQGTDAQGTDARGTHGQGADAQGAYGQGADEQADALPVDDRLPERVAELAGEISETRSERTRRRLTLALPRLAGRGGRGAWVGLQAGGRWLTTQVLAMAPRVPIRDVQTLREQFPGRTPEEVADVLIDGASRAAAGVGAAVGATMVLPVVPAAPIEIGVETLALVGIELKLVAELHEVYGMRAPGSAADRTLAYLDSWAHRRGVGLAPGGLVLAIGSPLRRQLERRLLVRAGRSATSLGPLLTGLAAGALLNRRETRKLGHDIRDDLRRRSPDAAHWPG
jgi:hypothetical protein